MRRTLRTVVVITAAAGTLAYAGAATAASAAPSPGPATSSPAADCGPDGQLSMTNTTDLFYSQTSTPGHTVYNSTTIVNHIGAIPHAGIRVQIIPESQNTGRPPLPNVEWRLDGGAWHNPQVSWITDMAGDPYWAGPDLTIGTLTTGSHKVEVGFTFATGDWYGVYGANVYVDADRCPQGSGISTYGSGYLDAAFDGPSSVATGGGSTGSSGGSGGSKGSVTKPGTASGAHTDTTPSATPAASASAGASTPTAADAAASSAAAAGAGPSPTRSNAAGAQDLAVQNTAARSSVNPLLWLSLLVLAAFAGAAFVLRRRSRVSTDAGPDEPPTV